MAFVKRADCLSLFQHLNLMKKAAKAFKKILEKESDASEVIAMLSALSEIPLFMDKKMYDLGATSSMVMTILLKAQFVYLLLDLLILKISCADSFILGKRT